MTKLALFVAILAPLQLACGGKTNFVDGVLALPDGEALLFVVDGKHDAAGSVLLAGRDGPKWVQPDADTRRFASHAFEAPSAAADAARVYTLATGGEVPTHVRARDRKTGAEQWLLELPQGMPQRQEERLLRPLVVAGDTLFVSLQTRSPNDEAQALVVAVDVATGKQRWRVARPSPVLGEAFVADKVVIVSIEDGWLWLDKATGAVLKTEALTGIGCRFGDVVVGMLRGSLAALSFDPTVAARPIGPQRDDGKFSALDDIRECTPHGKDLVIYRFPSVIAVDPRAATIVWETRLRAKNGLGLAMRNTGEVEVVQVVAAVADKHEGGTWSSFDLASGKLEAHHDGPFGAVQLGGVSLLIDVLRLGTDMPERSHMVVFDRAGKPTVGLSLAQSALTKLGSWNEAGGLLWLVRSGPFATPADAAWAALDLASGKLVSEQGSHQVELLDTAARDVWLATTR